MPKCTTLNRRLFLKASVASASLAALGPVAAMGASPTTTADGPVSAQVPLRIYGQDAYPVWHRRPLPLDAPRVRYTGFKPETLHLKKGEVRREGALTLPCDIILDRDVPVTLRDGVIIYTDVFRPATSGKYPAIVSWSPYGKQIGGQWLDDLPKRFNVPFNATSDLMKWEGVDPAFWVNQGYVVLHPDIRGSYKSGGNLAFWGRQIAEDGYDYIEWAAGRDWSDGHVGMAGNSWLTVSQWFIAAERPPHLSAIAPWEGVSDVMRDDFMRGGIPRAAFPEMLVQTFAGEGLMEDLTKMAVTEPNEAPYWTDKIAKLDRIEIPAYVVASYDNPAHTHGTFEGWRRIASKDKWLRVHNTQEWSDFYHPAHTQELLAFFDHYLKGTTNGWEKTPRVRISVLDPGGKDETGRIVETFPPEKYPHRKLFLTDKNSLSTGISAHESVIDYDTDGGSATFTMAVDTESELVGYMKLRLFVEADGSDDMDLTILVEKLDAQGNQPLRSTHGDPGAPTQATGFLRVSRRALDEKRSTPSEPYLLMQGEQRLAKGEIVTIDISIWPIALKLHPGELLSLTVLPYKAIPIVLPFGQAKLDVPADVFTFDPDHPPKMMTLGGDASTSPAWAKQQEVHPEPRNRGKHRIHLGGRFDSHLLVPVSTV